ncbi:SUMF1/EgtB/PvdO family nonheme iron enzyme [Candidatus Accumulibacter vicinus]|uniref:Serine/threonine-protein kinase pkn1 n=1 Tax=Candidatus Accumulibacter vicinus TaxID=2954382 RepID=A0A084XUE6_9PROT|nr:SUMF1/EgtB/PvdO family nonheme iron enzyme [Candidatus Accumulibacter vicinus]KFB66090.1 MAG: Serine/threonine-protein kinase pkn1 [Candidatus Accumulibacter vicinus]
MRFNLFARVLIGVALGLPLPLLAQEPSPRANEHRVALVIGNSSYTHSPLKNPVNDARAMRDKLKKMDFDVIIRENMKARDIGGALREFRSKLKPGSIALFFYAGHGLQIRGENYLPAVDAEISSEEDVPHQSLNVNTVLNTMEDSKAGVNLVLLDACRNNPFTRSFRSGAGAGLARIQAPSGTLIHYATRPGSVAEDGDGVNGTYTAALLAQIEEKGVPIEQALKRVTVRVKNVTKGKQEPWMEGSLTGDFYFIISGPTQINIQSAPADADAAAWQAAEAANTAVAYQAYLNEYPKGVYAAAARVKLAGLAAQGQPQPQQQQQPRVKSEGAPPEDRDTTLWQQVQAGGNRDYYETYLKEFPRGKYAPLARAELKRLAAQEKELQVQAEKQAWEKAQQINSEESYQSYLTEYPRGTYAALAQAALKKARKEEATRIAQGRLSMRDQQRPTDDRKTPTERPEKKKQDEIRQAAIGALSLARLSPGDYPMGAAADDVTDNPEADEAARPQHNVRIGNFELAYYEVTVGQFRKFVEATAYLTEAERPGRSPGCHVARNGGDFVIEHSANWRSPGFAQTDSHPVVCVSWNDTQAYIAWLNGGATGYRLPSEAEWEYAARGGSVTPRPWSDTGNFFARVFQSNKGTDPDQPPSRACRNANIADETLKKLLAWPVTHNCSDAQAYTSSGGYFGRNGFSLYDMIGNVGEWTQDCWNPNHSGAPLDGKARTSGDCSQRVIRGGSWSSGPAYARSAARQKNAASYRAADLGFRLAKTSP